MPQGCSMKAEQVISVGKFCRYCKVPTTHKRWNSWMCLMHSRFSQMRSDARKEGNLIPTMDQLHNFHAGLKDMKCPHCQVKMNWLKKDGTRTVITLQHYRNGSMGFLCFSCNSRHSKGNGDDFMDIPITHKRCSCCRYVLPMNAFGTETGLYQNKSHRCRPCRRNKLNERRRGSGREQYNAYMRAYKAKRKLKCAI